MDPMSDGERDPRGGPGCLAAALASAGLVVLAPFVALVRWWRRVRRGTGAVVRWRSERGTPFAVLDVTVDVPAEAEIRARRGLVDALVRVAEHLRRPDDLYDLVWREAGETESSLVAVGPTLQGLGQRLDIALAHRGSERRTQLWLTLPRGTHLAELVDPFDFDPEAEGAAVTLLRRAAPRWAMELSFARAVPSVLYRLRLHVPAGEVRRVEEILVRYRRQMEMPSG